VWQQDDLTVSLVDKCKQSQPVIQRIIESTTDDEAMLFEALNLHDELQQVILRYNELEAGIKSREHLPESSSNTGANILPAQVEPHNETKIADTPEGPAQAEPRNETRIADPPEGPAQAEPRKETRIADPQEGPAQVEPRNETKTADPPKGESAEFSSQKKIDEREFS
jgi:hypothetical protein